jgi:hypothetical protein
VILTYVQELRICNVRLTNGLRRIFDPLATLAGLALSARYVMRQEKKMLVAFGVHIGDIGKRPHPKMAVWIPQLNSALADGGSKARIVSFFGKTGNFVVDAPESEAATIRGLLTSVARTPFAVLDPAVVRRCVGALEGVEKPRDEEGCTWGLGASFCTTSPPPAFDPNRWNTKKGWFCPIEAGIVAVWKRENLTDREVLDSSNRITWGFASQETGRRFGGTWTARAVSAINGVLGKVPAA